MKPQSADVWILKWNERTIRTWIPAIIRLVFIDEQQQIVMSCEVSASYVTHELHTIPNRFETWLLPVATITSFHPWGVEARSTLQGPFYRANVCLHKAFINLSHVYVWIAAHQKFQKKKTKMKCLSARKKAPTQPLSKRVDTAKLERNECQLMISMRFFCSINPLSRTIWSILRNGF